MQWGPQKAFYNFFFPGRYTNKETKTQSDTNQPHVLSARACLSSSPYADFGYYYGGYNLPALETIVEDEEYVESDECDECDDSSCQKGSTSSSPILDSNNQIFPDCSPHSPQPLTPLTPSSTGNGEICESEYSSIQEQAGEGSTSACGFFLPTRMSSESQESVGDEDYQKLGDIVGADARYKLLDERIATEANLRLAIDTQTNAKVILIVFKSDVSHKHCDLLRFEECKHIPKMLNIIRVADGRCILVLECGSYTLSEWMKSSKHDLPSRKAVVEEILEAFVDLHGQRIRSGKVKPSLLMWYPTDQSWKFLGPYVTLENSKKSSHSRRYAAPELIQNEAKWQSIMMQQSSDMWSFGAMTFEILSGKRLHDPAVSLETVGKYLFGKKPLPSLNRIQEPAARRLLKKLLSVDPRDRPTAKQTLKSTYFRPVQDVYSTRLTWIDPSPDDLTDESQIQGNALSCS